MCKFSRKSSFSSYVQHKNRKTNNSTHFVPVRCLWKCVKFTIGLSQFGRFYLIQRPHGPITCTWWRRYGLCQRHKPTWDYPLLFLFCSCVCFCLYDPFNLYFIPQILPTTLRVLPVLILPYWFFQLKGLPQPWYNPLWLTGLKAPTN